MGQLLDHCDTFVFQLESAPTTGYQHYQGYFELVNKQRFTWIQNSIRKFEYLAPAKGTPKQNLCYCTKAESRLDGPWQVGEFRTDETANKTEAFVKAVGSGSTDLQLMDEFPSLFLRHNQQLQLVRAIKNVKPRTRIEMYGDDEVEIYVFFGEPGTGKSYAARQLYPDIYDVPIQRKGNFWLTDAAHETPVILIEDFDGNMPLKNLNRLLDPYAMQMEKKGGYVRWIPKIVILTTNTPPHLWYPKDGRQNVLRQIYRRITKCFDFNTEGGKNMTVAVDCASLEKTYPLSGQIIRVVPRPFNDNFIGAFKRATSFVLVDPTPPKKARTAYSDYLEDEPDIKPIRIIQEFNRPKPIFLNLLSDDEMSSEEEINLAQNQDCLTCLRRICMCAENFEAEQSDYSEQ